jgi:hypothetical protein
MTRGQFLGTLRTFVGNYPLERPGQGNPSDRHVVRGPLLEVPPSFVVNLDGSHLPMTEELLDLNDINPGVQEQRCRGGSRRMRCVSAPACSRRPGEASKSRLASETIFAKRAQRN